jgi:hypothetical protein
MATLSAQRKHQVTVVGSGNWYVFRPDVKCWQDVKTREEFIPSWTDGTE